MTHAEIVRLREARSLVKQALRKLGVRVGQRASTEQLMGMINAQGFTRGANERTEAFFRRFVTQVQVPAKGAAATPKNAFPFKPLKTQRHPRQDDIDRLNLPHQISVGGIGLHTSGSQW